VRVAFKHTCDPVEIWDDLMRLTHKQTFALCNRGTYLLYATPSAEKQVRLHDKKGRKRILVCYAVDTALTC